MIPLWPRAVVVHVAKLTGKIAMLFPLKEKRIGLINLDAVFGNTKSTAEKRAILASSFATFTQTMLDVIWFSRNPDARIQHYVSFPDSDLKTSFFEDKPLMCITAHMGSWEILGQTTALLGADLASIAAPIKNPLVDKIFIERREMTGQTIIPRKGALKTLISRFRKNGKAAFVLDQNTDEAAGGIMVDFLGLPMSVSPAPAALAYRTGTEIMIGFCLPQPRGRYRIHISDCITPPPFESTVNVSQVVQKLTQEIEDKISTEIRKYPEFWLWSYKHWRRKPNVDYPAHYPDY
ncbi:lysophospholipid acyltransferase family protein [Pontiellaceae bacterium B12227]|nr:lysophospholipid acyltransferase family protein [Pontiellaceae bacterium B12227]